MLTKTTVMEKVLLSAYKFLKTLCKYINLGFKPQILEHLFWRTVPLAVSDPCSILLDKR